MQARKNWQKLKNQKGAAIVSVMIIIIFVSGVVIGLMFWLWSESKRTTQVKVQTKAVYLAEAGAQVALSRLQKESGTGGTLAYQNLISSTTFGDSANFTLVFPGSGTVNVTLQEFN